MGWGQVDIVAGETRANVIPLHSNKGRVAARRRAEASRQHPSLLSDPHNRASAEQLAAVVREIDEHRRVGGGTSATEAPLSEFAQQVAAVAGFFRQRLTGDYTVDEFGFDPHFNNAVVRPLLRFFFKSWFRVEVTGIENLPSEGAALLVANHAGVLPFDGLMLSVAVHDEHPAQRDMRLLA
ncbi:1-acyl-sn-glycerol-3-phosphate acyltransferase, partial [Mycobacterium montefiorense]